MSEGATVTCPHCRATARAIPYYERAGNALSFGPVFGGFITASMILLASWIMDVGRETAEDAEALWAYVQTTPDDLGAWKRLLTQLEFRDPRRPLAAARVGELRAALM